MKENLEKWNPIKKYIFLWHECPQWGRSKLVTREVLFVKIFLQATKNVVNVFIWETKTEVQWRGFLFFIFMNSKFIYTTECHQHKTSNFNSSRLNMYSFEAITKPILITDTISKFSPLRRECKCKHTIDSVYMNLDHPNKCNDTTYGITY